MQTNTFYYHLHEPKKRVDISGIPPSSPLYDTIVLCITHSSPFTLSCTVYCPKPCTTIFSATDYLVDTCTVYKLCRNPNTSSAVCYHLRISSALSGGFPHTCD